MDKPVENKSTTKIIKLPVLPLRDVVVFPHMVIPLFVGREKSISALEAATSAEKQIFLAAQCDSEQDDPQANDIYEVGCVATILQLLKLPDGTVKVLVEGTRRGQIITYSEIAPCFNADVELLDNEAVDPREAEVIVRSLLSSFDQYVKLNRKIPPEILTSLSGIEEPSRLVDSIAAHMTMKVEDKQSVLEIVDVAERAERCIALMETEIDLLEVESRIKSQVKKQMEKTQREYYLKEQMSAIQKELGGMDDVPDEMAEYERKIEKGGLSKEAKQKAKSEFNKLKSMPPMSAEATVTRNYLDVLVNLPWKKSSKVNHDLLDAEKILENDHYGLEEVKERILEYLAVQQRVEKLKGPVLCLVGPPGVGKTSLGESIARATGRKFVRVSLGGVRDEAEIRGHRRTYIGALPGKVIQKIGKVGVRNPLFLLDEVDKMAMDFRGDPASALLEVLDPEQNSTFNDHYLEVDYDLSSVMFICTANSLNIPAPLLDRMEVIRIPGYTEDEKVNIALKHLIPKQIALAGLKDDEISISEGVIRDIIRHYCREAGVRHLEREISKLCRKVVREILRSQATKAKKGQKATQANSLGKRNITQKNLEKYLGVQKFRYGIAEESDRVGLVTGLAWTEVGGELLTIEAAAVSGKGKATYTGQLGEVMQESIHAAMTVVRNRAESLGIPSDFYANHDIHVHVPEGATPKDGPSAGIGMCTALVSVLTGIPVRREVAMTGEITLRGEILPIGGLKEKLLAAHRGGIKIVIIPQENKRELKEIPSNITSNLDIRPMRWVDEVLEVALVRQPKPLSSKRTTKQSATASKETKKSRRSGAQDSTSTH